MLVALVGTLVWSVGAGVTTVPASGLGLRPWHIQASPDRGTFDNLYGTAAVEPKDVWAVGRYINGSDVSQSLIEHWDGTAWSQTPSHVPAQIDSSLFAVAATPDARDVWAVGTIADPAGVDDQTLVDHWNGRRWVVMASASPGVLSGVTALSPDDVWAVGEVNGATLTEHWDGQSWSIVPSPDPGGIGSALTAVTAVSSTDVWAAGSMQTTRFDSAPLIEHWDGSAWQAVPTPPVDVDSDFRSIAAVSATDVWAVGGDELSATLIEHWDGQSWSIVPSPSPGNDDILLGVTALSTSDVWAVGSQEGGKDLIEQWNGSAWAIVPGPNRRHALDSLFAVSVDVKGGLWAVGGDIDLHGTIYDTLIEHALPQRPVG